MDSESEIKLKVARYEEGRYDKEDRVPHVFLSQPKRTPWPPPSAMATPDSIPLPTSLIQKLFNTKASLKAQIGGLKQVFTLQYELSDLSSQIRNLQFTMGKGMTLDKRSSSRPNCKMAYPVLTWS